MPKRLEYVTKLEKFTSLTIHFSSKFDKFSILYPHLKINFLEQLQNFQTKFGENSWFEKLAGNDDNSTNLKTTSNPVQNCGKSPLFRHPLPSKNCQKLLLQSFLKLWIFSKISFFFPFSYFHQKMLSFDFDFGKANSVFCKVCRLWKFYEKSHWIPNCFFKSWIFFNFCVFKKVCQILTTFLVSVGYFFKIVNNYFFESFGDFFKIY